MSVGPAVGGSGAAGPLVETILIDQHDVPLTDQHDAALTALVPGERGGGRTVSAGGAGGGWRPGGRRG